MARVKFPAGVSSVSAGGKSYEADEHGVVADVSPEHIALLASAGGRELLEDDEGNDLLLGFDGMPESVDVGAQEGELLGQDILQMAAHDAELSSIEWDDLPMSVRRILFERQVANLSGGLSGDIEHDGTRPDFASMPSKAAVADWITQNGGTPPATGTRAEYDAAADARWLELHPVSED